MKKLFTILAICFAVIAANAQVIFSEGFESGIPSTWTLIDSDGDGDGWSTYENAESAHSGNICATSASWTSAAGALTPDNWLISPAITLTSASSLSFYVAGQDPMYPNEHYAVYISTTGNTVADFTTPVLEETLPEVETTIHYYAKNIDLSSYSGTIYIAFRHFQSTDVFRLNIDDIEIFQNPTTPTIVPRPSTLSFSGILNGNYAPQSVEISGYNLTADMTVTSTANAFVSADAINFGSTATIPAAGGTLYVNYNYAVGGESNATITLSSAGAPNATIDVTGNITDCDNYQIPIIDDFSGGSDACWTFIDANQDGMTFSYVSAAGWMSYEDITETFPPADDWLVSPGFYVPANATANVYLAALPENPETYSIYLLSDKNDVSTAVKVVPSTIINDATFAPVAIPLEGFEGQHKYVGIRVESAQSYLFGCAGLEIDGTIVGIENNNINETMIYPNPVSDVLNISAEGYETVQIVNLLGQVVYSNNMTASQHQVNVSNFNSGVYFVRLANEQGVKTQKFIKK